MSHCVGMILAMLVVLGWEKRKTRCVRIIFSLFFRDPLSNPADSLAFGTVLWQSDWMLLGRERGCDVTKRGAKIFLG